MIDKLNIPIENKLTKEIKCYFNLDNDYWCKWEHNSEGKTLYYEDDTGYWTKSEYTTEGKRINVVTSYD